MQALQRASHPRTRSMEQDSLIRLADLESVTDFQGLEPLYVPQGNDGALHGRHLRQCALDLLDRFGAVEHALRGIVLPGLGRVAPPPRGVEARRIDSLLARLLQLGKGGGPGLASRHRLGAVGTDAEDPGAQRRAPFELVERGEHVPPGVLGNLVCGRSALDEQKGNAHQATMQLAHQRRERVLVARAQFGDELVVVGSAAHAREVTACIDVWLRARPQDVHFGKASRICAGMARIWKVCASPPDDLARLVHDEDRRPGDAVLGVLDAVGADGGAALVGEQRKGHAELVRRLAGEPRIEEESVGHLHEGWAIARR